VAHIGIAGAGLLGRLVGWQLLRRGHDVSLFDGDGPDGRRSAGRVAAAMLAPYAEVPHGGRHVLELGRAGVARWSSLLDELAADGEHVTLHRDGSIVVAHSADAGDLRQLRTDLATALGQDHAGVRDLDADALAQLEPMLAGRFHDGLHLTEEGYLENEALYPALHRAISALHGRWHARTRVDGVRPGHIETAAAGARFDTVIDCRGAGARHAVDGLRGVRGEVLRIHAPEVQLAHPVRLMHPRYRLYLVPRPERRYILGATEIESAAEGPVTVRAYLELLSGLYSVHPGFAEAEVEAASVGLRPAFPDNMPRIWARDGLIVANGLYRHGYLLGPLVADAVIALAEGRSVEALPLAARCEVQ